MLKHKLLVLLAYLNYAMCPSEYCMGYQNLLLTHNDIEEILYRINERRNFIAMGHFRYFPQAANMNKVTWSMELAYIAQRWADQCDSTIRPDKEDECRDLGTAKVGQNIATITGTSKGVSMKSFIDMWFIQSLAYTGSVTYYNMSRNSKSNYFTQLIWAKTNKVGCGRARFYINLQPVDRLVCNFSPGGNVQRRPLYIIGYPGTQCDDGMAVDLQFPGLCCITEVKKDRIRRETDDPVTFKPFWQVDQYSRQPQLKSMRYTTLPHKKTRKRRPMTPSTQKIKLATEPITIAITGNIKHPTEKYLSFDELLRLRKLNASDYNARRSNEATTAAPATETESSTSEYTANTPFLRLKHCTRKLTCTWTAASSGENEGNADIGNRGSRTPPGYVEGCTRTSTCTRDYMHRNKMDTLPTPSTEPEVDEGNDEDYCEKRSLNVRRRDSNQELVSLSTEFPLKNTLIKILDSENMENENSNLQKEDETNSEYCSCDDDYLRNKRDSDLVSSSKNGGKSERMFKREIESYNTLSYGYGLIP
ncbi:uncharacterized protein LOC119840576 [Zerene cesonia]|uniref:uncharacterized protein LOC119840576 n=1 Tax=Zerene cesonia TaxID=33412 RepID=UPI0018E523F5|nr:uncharacterized protein LOC119840576 [Zerene cesonia]